MALTYVISEHLKSEKKIILTTKNVSFKTHINA